MPWKDKEKYKHLDMEVVLYRMAYEVKKDLARAALARMAMDGSKSGEEQPL